MSYPSYDLTDKDVKEHSKFEVYVDRDGKEINSAMLYKRKRFMFIPYLSPHADLLEPVRKIDADIAKKEEELKALLDKRKQTEQEAITLIITFGKDVYKPGMLFKGKGSNPKPKDSGEKDEKESKPTRKVVTNLEQSTVSNNNNGGKGKQPNNQRNN